MQAFTIAIIGVATAQASQVEDKLRSLSVSSSDLLGPVQDQCNGMVDVKCQTYYSDDSFYCSQDLWNGDLCLDTDARFIWRELCDTQREAIGEDGWMFAYKEYYNEYYYTAHFFFVSQANYEEFLTSAQNDNCYWSGPMEETGFYPVNNGIGEEQDQCYDEVIDVTFDFKCHDYETRAAQSQDNFGFIDDRCLDSEGRIYWRDLTTDERSDLGEDGWVLYVVGEYTGDFHMITLSQYTEYLNSVENDDCYWSGPMEDTYVYKNGGRGDLEENCTDPTTSTEYDFPCQKYANAKAYQCEILKYGKDLCIADGQWILWREMCDDEKEAFGNQDGWMFYSGSGFYFFVSEDQYETYVGSQCRSGPMKNGQ